MLLNEVIINVSTCVIVSSNYPHTFFSSTQDDFTLSKVQQYTVDVVSLLYASSSVSWCCFLSTMGEIYVNFEKLTAWVQFVPFLDIFTLVSTVHKLSCVSSWIFQTLFWACSLKHYGKPSLYIYRLKIWKQNHRKSWLCTQLKKIISLYKDKKYTVLRKKLFI